MRIPMEIGLRPDVMLCLGGVSLLAGVAGIICGIVFLRKGRRGGAIAAFVVALIGILFQIAYLGGYSVSGQTNLSSAKVTVYSSESSNVSDQEGTVLSQEETKVLLDTLSDCRLKCSGRRFGYELYDQERSAERYWLIRIEMSGKTTDLYVDQGVGSFIHNPSTFGAFDLVLTEEEALQNWCRQRTAAASKD